MEDKAAAAVGVALTYWGWGTELGEAGLCTRGRPTVGAGAEARLLHDYQGDHREALHQASCKEEKNLIILS